MERRTIRVVLAATTVVAGGWSACYRDGAAPVVHNAAVVGESRPLAMTCGGDDLDAPPVDGSPDGRLRSQIRGSLAGRSGRSWVGPAVPTHVPDRVGTLELFLLDETDGGHLAFYREPYGVSSCGLGTSSNCTTEARFYDGSGKLAWTLPFAELLSRPDHLEIQDLRLAGGMLYFNEACQSYASGAGGQCSSLVAVDPETREVRWRTPPLTSNGRFRIRGCYIISGYGFTAEPDAVFLVDRATGKVLQQVPVSTSPERYTLIAGDRLDVELYSGVLRRYRLDGFDGSGGRLVPLDPPEPMYGGAGYGGMGYGGMGYGGMGYGGTTSPAGKQLPPRPRP